MAFKDFPEQQQGVMLLQRSLGRGRLGHAYLLRASNWTHWKPSPNVGKNFELSETRQI
jgi:hypothetical protein